MTTRREGVLAPAETPRLTGRQRPRQLLARAHAELAVHVAELEVDRVRRDEHRLRDLALAASLGRQGGHAPLGVRQRAEAARGLHARLDAALLELGACE